MVLGIQIAGALFGLFMAYYTFLQYKRKEFSMKEYLFWFALWIIFIIVTLMPEILDPIVKFVQISRTMDFFIIVGFIFLSGAIFYTYTIVRKSQRKVEKIVREIALKKK